MSNEKYKINKVCACFLLLASCFLPASGQVTYQTDDSVTVCRLLRQATPQTTTLWLARQFLGVPYVAHTLEVNGADEQLVVNTRQLDCTTLVETVAALKLCAQQDKRTWDDFVTMLRKLRYRGGRIDGYPSRLHYFSDWIRDKEQMQLVSNIDSPNPPFTAVQTLSVSWMSDHPQSYKALKARPGLVPQIRQQEQALSGHKVRYIPKRLLNNNKLLRQCVRDGDIIVILTNKRGLDTAHLGFASWHGDGLHLLNASQLRKKVVDEPMTLSQYMRQHPTFTGIRVVRLPSANQ